MTFKDLCILIFFSIGVAVTIIFVIRMLCILCGIILTEYKSKLFSKIIKDSVDWLEKNQSNMDYKDNASFLLYNKEFLMDFEGYMTAKHYEKRILS